MSLGPERGAVTRLIVIAEPRLLREAIVRVLSTREGLEITSIGSWPDRLLLDVVARRYDIAITTGGLPEGLVVTLVLRLDHPQGGDLGAGHDVIDLEHFEDILRTVDRWRAEHGARRRE